MNTIIRNFAVLLTCLIVSTTANAQFLGLKVGTNFNFKGDNCPVGTLGLTYEQVLNQHFSISTGVLGDCYANPLNGYYQNLFEGAKKPYEKMGRISIPLIGEYKYLITDHIRAFANLGITGNFYLDGSSDLDEYSGSSDYSEGPKEFLLGGTIGAGIELKNFRIGVQYDRDFGHITRFDTDPIADRFMVTFGVRFGGNKLFRKTSKTRTGTIENYPLVAPVLATVPATTSVTTQDEGTEIANTEITANQETQLATVATEATVSAKANHKATMLRHATAYVSPSIGSGVSTSGNEWHPVVEAGVNR